MKTDKYHRHEALHTTSLLCEMLNRNIIEHAYFYSEKNKIFNEKVSKAMGLLCEAYQSCNKGNEK